MSETKLNQSNGYRPVEYSCGDECMIRLCAKFVSCIGDKPEYWYIAKPLRPWHNRELWKSGFKLQYWCSAGHWNHCSPHQFETAEEAIEFHREHILDNK